MNLREQAEQLLALSKKATKGPWEWESEKVDCDPETGPWGEPPAVFGHAGDPYTNPITKIESDLLGFTVLSDTDAEFIALSRNIAPQLAREWEQQNATLTRIRELYDNPDMSSKLFRLAVGTLVNQALADIAEDGETK